MRLSAEHLQAQGFAQYRAQPAATAGRVFEAVAKPGSGYEVLDSLEAVANPNRSYSPPVSPIRSATDVFKAVANVAQVQPMIDVYV